MNDVVRRMLEDGAISQEVAEKYCPELKQSEDERIRKSLKILLQHFCKGYRVPGLDFPVSYKDMLIWLEKQGEKECSVPYVETSIKDGVYLLYEDQNGKHWYEFFSGHNDKENATGVAFKFGKVSLRLYKNDIKECDITTKQDIPCDYVTTLSKAVCDFEGRKRTQDLVERGLSCMGRIPNGWYIPAIGELYSMYLMKDQINEALEYIGAELIKDTWYWSSTEYSAIFAWGLAFNSGNFTYNGKSYNSFRVRPVFAFDPLTL